MSIPLHRPALSVIVPVFNERNTLVHSIERLRREFPDAQLILVEDASTDGSAALIQELAGCFNAQLIYHSSNRGKGAAIRSAANLVKGTLVVIHDADLEYNPADLHELIRIQGIFDADAVFGNRFPKRAGQGLAVWHRLGNRIISELFNVVCGAHVADVETCYKLMRSEYLVAMANRLQECRFGIEIELTAMLVRAGAQILNHPITYQSRTFSSGKKIGWRDGVSAIRCILQYGVPTRFNRLRNSISCFNGK